MYSTLSIKSSVVEGTWGVTGVRRKEGAREKRAGEEGEHNGRGKQAKQIKRKRRDRGRGAPLKEYGGGGASASTRAGGESGTG